MTALHVGKKRLVLIDTWWNVNKEQVEETEETLEF